jgi:CheY-like chemotaxis protein
MDDTSLSPLRVLVVDDDADTRETLALLLRMWGNDARGVSNGPSALVQADDYHPNVILLDICMPGMDGCEVARQLRQRPRSGEFYLVSLTGYDQEDVRRRSREMGCDEHWLKPVEPDVLRHLLEARKQARNASAVAQC